MKILNKLAEFKKWIIRIVSRSTVKDMNYWTKRQLKAVRMRDWDEDIGEFDSLIILPTKHKHDSGYACMDFVAVKDNKPLALLSGCSDVIHIDGIGGFGYKWLEKYNKCPDAIKPIGWNIDCLAKSGLLRIFTDKPMRVGNVLSSFQIYADR